MAGGHSDRAGGRWAELGLAPSTPRRIAGGWERLMGLRRPPRWSADPKIGPSHSMDFAQFVASGAPAMAEGAAIERVRRHTSFTLDPHVLNGGLIYDPAARAYVAEIHRGYIRA